ncbi:uroporphyrin-III C-methyltransferase / precorrin-2 dehydrogenase / sirohydrochlorin ferrochelatase [Sphingomonas palmae]|uniref:precorrin-2 dehydrogenase n=1 Tax=Sphingomonas palmae TaxID=1855283 RepID=A0A1H7RN95_9SPHN|nr:NAD(P)-dependent oxidoreductase [Sphingomonas palmae]SEL60857.1 uroporphyrin-III C-methyltransferase / precorrin-2 dehydrogenase / sirohydrochlorin ferrochelatase [Sphingomonas palmae]
MSDWPALPIFVRLSGRAVVLVGEGEAADAKRRLLERAGAVIVGEDRADEARLAVVADNEPAAHRLKQRGLLVNVVDRPALCDFTLPAIVDRAPVLVAVGTGGVSAGLAAAVRQRLEAILPAGLGRLAEALHAARDALRARYPDTPDRRRAIGAALASGGALDPLRDHDSGDVVARITAGASARVEHVRLRSRDPDDLTLREARWLAQADRVTHRDDVPTAVLDRARADAVREGTDAVPVDSADGLTVDVAWQEGAA